MPKRKRKSIGQIPTKAKKIKLLRANETNAQRQQRLQAMKDRDETSRADESEDKQDRPLQKMREQASILRTNESENKREHRLQKVREHRGPLNLKINEKEYSKHEKVIIGEMSQICKYCSTKKYKCEPPGMCCCSGKVRLPALGTPPESLLSYMSGTTSESKHFRKNIRRYNSCFQMTSFGASSIVGRSGFETTFKVKYTTKRALSSLFQVKMLSFYKRISLVTKKRK
ncbi:hypothetical protein AVEN_137967-1 [Araneus ventricosus]|uniref:Uncharacterized protein n=1 Tax=Araneus ventricosus TaxID=182803 RepID=A0A4Y2RDI3_ARAVE|nr:hypothetical protein AVEN_137967-1 [Araneus ventricosus]